MIGLKGHSERKYNLSQEEILHETRREFGFIWRL